MNKLTKIQYWQAHASATKLLNDGCSAFEEGVAKLFFVCDLYNAAALVATFPAIFSLEVEDEAPDHWQIDEDLPSSYNSAGSVRNDQQ